MAAKRGQFDESQVAAGWFDETAQAAGWFDGDLLAPPEGGGADTVTASDTASLALTESASLSVSQAAADTASLTLTESATVLASATVSASDTASLTLSESAVVAEVAEPETETTFPGGLSFDAAAQRRKFRKLRGLSEDEEAEPPPAIEPAKADVSEDIERLRRLVAYYVENAPADDLSRRAQRALDYAKAARSTAALAMFERELAKQMEEEDLALIVALIVALLLDD